MKTHFVKIGRTDSGFFGVPLLLNASFAGLSYLETTCHSNRNNTASPFMHLQLMHLSILCPTTPLPGNVGGMEGYLTSFDIKSSPIHGEFDSYHYACTEVCYK